MMQSLPHLPALPSLVPEQVFFNPGITSEHLKRMAANGGARRVRRALRAGGSRPLILVGNHVNRAMGRLNLPSLPEGIFAPVSDIQSTAQIRRVLDLLVAEGQLSGAALRRARHSGGELLPAIMREALAPMYSAINSFLARSVPVLATNPYPLPAPDPDDCGAFSLSLDDQPWDSAGMPWSFLPPLAFFDDHHGLGDAVGPELALLAGDVFGLMGSPGFITSRDAMQYEMFWWEHLECELDDATEEVGGLARLYDLLRSKSYSFKPDSELGSYGLDFVLEFCENRLGTSPRAMLLEKHRPGRASVLRRAKATDHPIGRWAESVVRLQALIPKAPPHEALWEGDGGSHWGSAITGVFPLIESGIAEDFANHAMQGDGFWFPSERLAPLWMAQEVLKFMVLKVAIISLGEMNELNRPD